MPRYKQCHPSIDLRATFLVAALLSAGCLGVESSSSILPATATLELTVASPPGIAVQITVTGPQGFTKTLSIDGVQVVDLDGLAPGSYTFSAPVVVVPTSLVDTVWSIDESLSGLSKAALSLPTGQTTTFSLTYSVRPGSGSIFLTRFSDARVIGGWPAASLLAGTNPPATQLVLTTYEDWSGLAVDSSGGLWLLANDLSTSSLLYFASTQLAAGQSQPMPILLQPGGRLDAFCLDNAGGIWGASQSEQRLYYWSSTTIASGNLLTPDVIVQGAAGALSAPIAIAFDSVGSLWVANAAATSGANGTLERYVPRQFAASGYYLPTVQFPVVSPRAMLFDASGSLWVSSGLNSLLRFGTADLGGGAAAPAATITLDADATASGLAFDALGDLWVAETHAADGSGSLVMLAPGQIAATGTPTAFVALQTPPQAGAASLILIDPTPAGLPLAGAPQ